MATYAFGGGVAAIPPYGQKDQILFGGTWAVGDTWRVDITSTAGDVTVGLGRISSQVSVGKPPTACFTFVNRVFLALTQLFGFSDNGDPTGWEVQNPGAGTIDTLTQYAGQDNVYGFASYQGFLAVFLRNCIQIWSAPANPANFVIKQTLPNIGSRYPLTVQSLGDFDVLFLADTGVRSLRVRDSSLNASIIDIGTPIDSLVLANLAQGFLTPPCGVVDTNSGRYWLYVNTTSFKGIYVLSKYDASKIAAWGVYRATYQDGSNNQQAFIPSKFVVYNGTVYCRGNDTISGNDYLFTYGGGYDNCIATVQIPWLSAKTPTIQKKFNSLDLAVTGSWSVSFGCDPTSGALTTVATISNPTFDISHVGLAGWGTHFSVKAVTTGSTAALIGNMSIEYSAANETKTK